MSFSSSLLNPMNMARYLKNRYRNLCFELEMKRCPAERYEQIRALKDSHKGERCFVVCTGPSLTVEDIRLIQNEFVFAMNSFCKLFAEMEWRPAAYGVQDLHVYDKLAKDLENEAGKMLCFTGSNVAAARTLPSGWTVYPFNYHYNSYDQCIRHKYYTKFSDDCSKVVYDGYSITYSLLQIAAYMGFKEIYLLGADNNYTGKKLHFIEHGHQGANLDTAGIRLNAAYACAKEYADRHGIRIYNATRGGMLEVFPRKSLEEVLGIEK